MRGARTAARLPRSIDRRPTIRLKGFLAPLGKKRWFVFAKRRLASVKPMLAHFSRQVALLSRCLTTKPGSTTQLYYRLAFAIESAVDPLPPHIAAINRQYGFRCEHFVRAVQKWISDCVSANPRFDAPGFLASYCRDWDDHKAVRVAAALEYRRLDDVHSALHHISKALALDANDLFTQEVALALFHWADPTLPDPKGVDAYLKSRFCTKPFEHFETGAKGKVTVCCAAWLPVPIGNLNDHRAGNIWNSPAARELRASILDGTFRYCSRMHCGDITNRALPSSSGPEARRFAQSFRSWDTGGANPRPATVILSHDSSCNLACPTCRKDFFHADKRQQGRYDQIADSVILPLLSEARLVHVTGSGDPFGSSHFRRLLKNIAQTSYPHLKIHLHTNAQLFNERAWQELGLSGKVRSCEISIDAASAETYHVVRRGGDFKRLLKNLEFVKTLHASGELQYWTASFVVQARNFREMPEFVRLMAQFGPTAISFQMIRNWGTFSPEEFASQFIGDCLHPDHVEFLEVLESPELHLPHVQLGNMASYSGVPAQ